MGWVKYATVGAKAGTDLKDSGGNVLDNDEIRNIDISISQGTGGVLTLNRGGGGTDTTTINKTNLGLTYTDGATVGAIFGSNMYSAGTTLFTAAQLKNANQDWQDVSGTGIPADGATAGATWGGNITSQPSDANILNSGTFTGTIGSNSNQAVSVVNALSRINKITNAGEFSGSLAAAQFPRVGVLTAASTTLARAAIGAGTSNVAVGTGGGDALAGNTSIPPDVTASSGGTVHTTNYKSTKAELGLSYTDGATVGAVFGTNMYDTNGSTNLTAALVKNSSITLNVLGYLDNIGTTERLSNTKLIATDMAGSGKPFAVLPASAATNNGSTINTSGNVAGVITVGSNISISSTSEYILISD